MRRITSHSNNGVTRKSSDHIFFGKPSKSSEALNEDRYGIGKLPEQ